MSKTRRKRDPNITTMVEYYQRNKKDIHARCREYNFPPKHFRMFRIEILQRMEYRGESVAHAIDNILGRMRDNLYSITPVMPLKFHEDGMPNTGNWQAMLTTLNKGLPHVVI